MQQIDDLTLIKCLGKGSFGEVYLSKKKGKQAYFATKKISRAQADQPSLRKYFKNEIEILNSIRHQNIVRLEDVKQKNDYYYIVMEYINGGSLSDCLKKYQNINGRAFPEVIVQYLMRQIIDAIKYLHNLKIIHRDLKLDNIMVSFDNEIDKNNLNMMRAKIKIIDFGFAIHLNKNNLAFSALGSPINMDPLILKKFADKKRDINQLGYDSKADIWSLGTICYEMLIGKAVFNAETMNELVKKVEDGSYNVPTTVSSELVSFLNGMLQYNGECRLSAEELSKHPFLIKNVNDLTKINIKKVSKKIDAKGLNINVKRNQTIWAIFNKEDEEKLINIKGGRDLPAPEGPISEEYTHRNKRSKTEKNIPRIQDNKNVNNKNYQKTNLNLYPSFGAGNSFYGQSMGSNPNGNNQINRTPLRPGIQQTPGTEPAVRKNQQLGINYNNIPTSNINNYPTFGVPMPYSYGKIQNNNFGVPPSYPYGPTNTFGVPPSYPYGPTNAFGVPQSYPPGYGPINGFGPPPYPPSYAPNANKIPRGYSQYNNRDEDDLTCLIQ